MIRTRFFGSGFVYMSTRLQRRRADSKKSRQKSCKNLHCRGTGRRLYSENMSAQNTNGKSGSVTWSARVEGELLEKLGHVVEDFGVSPSSLVKAGLRLLTGLLSDYSVEDQLRIIAALSRREKAVHKYNPQELASQIALALQEPPADRRRHKRPKAE